MQRILLLNLCMVEISQLIACILVSRQLKERNIAIRKKCNYRWDNPEGTAGNSSRVLMCKVEKNLSLSIITKKMIRTYAQHRILSVINRMIKKYCYFIYNETTKRLAKR